MVSKPTDNTKKAYFWNAMNYIALMTLFTIKIKLSFEEGKYNCWGLTLAELEGLTTGLVAPGNQRAAVQGPLV